MTRALVLLLGITGLLLVPRVALADSWGCDNLSIVDGSPKGACCDVHDSCYATYGCTFSAARFSAAATCAAADIAPNSVTCSACTGVHAIYGGDPCFVCDTEVQHCIGGGSFPGDFPGPGECTNFNGLANVCGTARNSNNKFGCADNRFCEAGRTCNTSTGLCSGGRQPPPQPPAIVPWDWPFDPNGCADLCASMGQCGFGVTPCGVTFFGICPAGQSCQSNQCVNNCQWYDCLGQCNGDAQYDCAGLCNGGTPVDCAGICNGSTQVDCAGTCGGSAHYDCAGVCNGNAHYDCNGVCNGNAQYDCNGVCNGGAQYDDCGVCGGDGSECGGGCGCGGCGGCGGGCGGCGCGIIIEQGLQGSGALTSHR
jgi:hypothetical protein